MPGSSFIQKLFTICAKCELSAPALLRYAPGVRTADFHFDLPPELIAQQPAARRDGSRLLVLQRKTKTIAHRQFPDLLEFLNPGDVLVLNNSRVIPARLRGKNARTGGQFEILLLEENGLNDWWAMTRPRQTRQNRNINPVARKKWRGLENNGDGHCRE